MPTADVLIVGSGPAGLHAGIELQRRFGLSALILEREREPGGVPRWCHHHTFPCRIKKRLFTGPKYVDAWLAEARSASVPILTETTVFALEHAAVRTTSPDGLRTYEARAVLLATGARESHRHSHLVAGDRVRGIHTTASLFQCIYQNQTLPGRRFVVFGSEDVSYSCANVIRSHGASATIVEPAPATRSYPLVRWYFEKLRGIPHFFGVRDFAIHGRSGVERVSFRTDTAHEIHCDGVVFTGGFIPNAELVRTSAAEFNSATRGPAVNQFYQTSEPWIFAAGNCLRGVVSGDEAAWEGRNAASEIARYLQGRTTAGFGIPLVTDAPLAYCFPDHIARDSGGIRQIAVWSQVHAENAELLVQQGGRTLWSARFRRVQPGRRLFIPTEVLRLSKPEAARISLSFP